MCFFVRAMNLTIVSLLVVAGAAQWAGGGPR